MSIIEDLQKKSGRAEKIDAMPETRELFFGFTRSGYKFKDALAEYIDNSFQQGLKAADPSSVSINVRVKADGSTYYLEITDNAGGAKRADAVNFIKPGSSGNDRNSDSFGLFGVGGKVAGLSVVNRAVIVISKAVGDLGFWTRLDKLEIETKSDWKFDVMPFPSDIDMQDGMTRVILYDVNSGECAKLTNDILFDFRKRYAYLLKRRNGEVPKIFLEDEQVTPLNPVEEMLLAKESPKGCEPKEYKDRKSVSVTENGSEHRVREIELSMIVGIMPSGSTIGGSGAAIYCNDRLIETNSQLALYELFDSQDTHIHPGSDKAWVRAVVRLDGPAHLMPWTSRKDGLDSSAPVYGTLKEFLKASYEDYLDDHIGPAREKLRGTPDYRRRRIYVSDILVDSYARKIRGGDLHVETVRKAVKESQSFKKAIEKAKGVRIADPPKLSDVVTVQGSIEREKLEKVRRVIEEQTGEDNLPNTKVIRYLFDHILKCMVGVVPPDAS